MAVALVAAMLSATASAQVYVKGYTKKDGTYVAPHYRSSPDGSRYNNYSTIGNMNPYTGQPGTKSPYSDNAYGSSGSVGTYTKPYSSSNQTGAAKQKTCSYFSPC
jgi:hypothetical protein